MSKIDVFSAQEAKPYSKIFVYSWSMKKVETPKVGKIFYIFLSMTRRKECKLITKQIIINAVSIHVPICM